VGWTMRPRATRDAISWSERNGTLRGIGRPDGVNGGMSMSIMAGGSEGGRWVTCSLASSSAAIWVRTLPAKAPLISIPIIFSSRRQQSGNDGAQQVQRLPRRLVPRRDLPNRRPRRAAPAPPGSGVLRHRPLIHSPSSDGLTRTAPTRDRPANPSTMLRERMVNNGLRRRTRFRDVRSSAVSWFRLIRVFSNVADDDET
jgi:hypothetical protein